MNAVFHPLTVIVPPKDHHILSTKHSRESSWSQAIRLQVRSNQFREAISSYLQMIISDVPPDNRIIPQVLKAVWSVQALHFGRQLHSQIVKLGYYSVSVPIANTLVTMYGNCNSLDEAYKVFDRIPERNEVSWNSFISCLTKFREWEVSVKTLKLMVEEGLEPTSHALVSIAVACSNMEKTNGLWLGKQLHAYTFRKDLESVFLNNALIAMYAKLDRIEDAKRIFWLVKDGTLISWNSMITLLSQANKDTEALEFLKLMSMEGVKPDAITFASTLPSCSHLQMLRPGMEIHVMAIKYCEFPENAFVGSGLIGMYSSCGKIESARLVFDMILEKEVGIWNSMIAGYAQNGYDGEALELFNEMRVTNDFPPNATTLTSILPAYARHQAFHINNGIHGYVIKTGLKSDRFVGNALIDMYSRMGMMETSKTIFEKMEMRDIVSWNAMITRYVNCGRPIQALKLLRKMQGRRSNGGQHSGIKPNKVTFMTALTGCGSLAAMAKGKEIHGFLIRNGLASDVPMATALVDMYAKSGSLRLSRTMFNEMKRKNVITWNAMIMACGMHGRAMEALELFDEMREHIKPTNGTFAALLAACSHSKMVEEGMNLFSLMKSYGVEPSSEHYSCIVDLLSRAGRLEEAYRLVTTMPSMVDRVAPWSSLLGGCVVYKNVEMGEIVAKELFDLQPEMANLYVLLSNIYSSVRVWDKAEEVRRMMDCRGVKKAPGCSWIEHGGTVHKFFAGDSSHLQSRKLHRYLKDMEKRLKKEGYVPDASCVFHNVEKKKDKLRVHSERLAIAFGLLNTPPGTTIRVAKNLRVCSDCHTATKLMSKIENREIIVRDMRRFHHFKNGSCSCADFW